jgi:hypothetical protein
MMNKALGPLNIIVYAAGLNQWTLSFVTRPIAPDNARIDTIDIR